MALIERWKLFVAAFLGCSLLGPVTFVMAEEEESASGGIMEEVVVTATVSYTHLRAHET